MPPSNQPNTGTFQLSLTSVAAITSNSAATEYFAHGNVQLTLVDQDPTPEPDVQITGSF